MFMKMIKREALIAKYLVVGDSRIIPKGPKTLPLIKEINVKNQMIFRDLINFFIKENHSEDKKIKNKIIGRFGQTLYYTCDANPIRKPPISSITKIRSLTHLVNAQLQLQF